MNVNTSVYGAADTWIESNFLSSGTMKAKCPNFNGGSTLDSSTLSVGNTAGKTPHNQLIDRSISFSALGTESLYSHLVYVNGSSSNITVDNVPTTEFFYCESRVMYNRRNVEENKNYINSNLPYNMWKEYEADPNSYYHNYSDITIPYTELNPKKILYVLQVYPCKADGTEYGQWVFFGTYDRNASNIQTNYPYIMGVRLNPRIDNTTTATPNRTTLTDPDALFGVAINREFSALQNDDIKINYAISRCMMIDNIIIYGNEGKETYGENKYNIFIARENDIQFDTVNSLVYAMMEYDKDFILQQAACFGVYFRISDQGSAAGSITTLPLDSDGVCLGLLDENGIGHGEYTSGAANRDNPIYNWSSYSESPYDYTRPVDPTQYDNTTGFYSMSPVWSCNRMYVTTEDNIMKAAQAIATAISLKPQDQTVTDYSLGSFLTNNPVDCIISIKKYPIQDIPKGTTQNIKFGAYENNQVQGAPLQTMHDKFDFVFTSGNNIFPVFGDSFLDYEPYTHAELIIPFCGSVQLPMADFMGATIKVKLIVDYITGACTAYVCKNDLAITSISGQIGIEVPISGVQGATLESQIVNANLQYKAQQLAGAGIAAGAVVSTVGAVGSVATGNAIGAIGSAGGLVGTVTKAMQHEVTEKAAEYAATHVQVPFKQVSAGSPLVSGVYEYSCRLIIYRPILDPAYDPEEYGHTIGFATIETGTLGEHSGLVQVSSVDLSGVPCTVTESQMIEAALKGGVYI